MESSRKRVEQISSAPNQYIILGMNMHSCANIMAESIAERSQNVKQASMTKQELAPSMRTKYMYCNKSYCLERGQCLS